MKTNEKRHETRRCIDECLGCACCELSFTDIGKARYERGWHCKENIKALDEFDNVPSNSDEALLNEFAPKKTKE